MQAARSRTLQFDPERCSLIEFYFDSATGKAGEWESWRSGKKVPDEEAVEAMMRWLAVSAGALLVLVGQVVSCV
jgi:hypothetical protein